MEKETLSDKLQQEQKQMTASAAELQSPAWPQTRVNLTCRRHVYSTVCHDHQLLRSTGELKVGQQERSHSHANMNFPSCSVLVVTLDLHVGSNTPRCQGSPCPVREHSAAPKAVSALKHPWPGCSKWLALAKDRKPC